MKFRPRRVLMLASLPLAIALSLTVYTALQPTVRCVIVAADGQALSKAAGDRCTALQTGEQAIVFEVGGPEQGTVVHAD